jgi:hypothetical protein
MNDETNKWLFQLNDCVQETRAVKRKHLREAIFLLLVPYYQRDTVQPENQTEPSPLTLLPLEILYIIIKIAHKSAPHPNFTLNI